MSDSPYTDLGRPPLHQTALRRVLVRPGELWTDVRVVVQTASTNADVAEAARSGAAEGLVIVAERQSAGRGRMGRGWVSPPRAGLAVSVLLRPAPPAARWGWLPLLAGVALVEAVGRVALVDAALKWPNDLLVRSATDPDPGYGKCAGVLAEVVRSSGRGAGAVVLGIGLNVHQRADELPPRADAAALPPVSLALAGALCTDRDPLLRALLRTFADWYDRWTTADGDPETSGVREAYVRGCATLGGRVRVELPDGSTVEGIASDVDADGRLVVVDPGGARRAVAAGDVRHVR
jgi:BirA family biotin operon repressor/biotin-[acetyl-CoA-carboxylase] ligase